MTLNRNERGDIPNDGRNIKRAIMKYFKQLYGKRKNSNLGKIDTERHKVSN